MKMNISLRLTIGYLKSSYSYSLSFGDILIMHIETKISNIPRILLIFSVSLNIITPTIVATIGSINAITEALEGSVCFKPSV